MKQKILISLSTLLIIGGVIVGYRPLMNWWRQHQTEGKYGPAVTYQVDPKETEAAKRISGEPVKIDIPSVNISIPVVDGFYNEKSKAWTLTLNKAHYATVTPQPNNQGGNTFIYGHNRWEVFYRLPKIKMGDEAVVTTQNGHKFTYKLSNVKTTTPNDVSLFQYKGAPILTLQTCTGMWYQNRTLFSFQLVKVA